MMWPADADQSSSRGFYFQPLFELSVEGQLDAQIAEVGAGAGTPVGQCQWCPQGTYQPQNNFNCAGELL